MHQRICQSAEQLVINELGKKRRTQVYDTGHPLYETVPSSANKTKKKPRPPS